MNSRRPVVPAIIQVECLRCGHKWIPRSFERPFVCSKCKSPRWDRPPRQRAKKEGA